MRVSQLPGWGVLQAMCLAALGLLSGCVSRGDISEPEEVSEFSTITAAARSAYDQGRMEQAARLYGLARARATATDDAEALGDANYNLAVCKTLLGEYAAARMLLEEIGWVGRVSESQRDEVILLASKIVYLQGDLRESAEILDDAIASGALGSSPRIQVEVSLLRGHQACDRQDLAAAGASLEEARFRSGEETENPGLARLAGQIHLTAGAPAAAAAEFDREAELLKGMGRFWSVSSALARAGHAYGESGNWEKAANRLYRGARSALAHGRYGDAETRAQEALEAAGHLPAGDDREQITGLIEELLGEWTDAAGLER